MTPGMQPIAFAEKVLTLLDLGSYSATYKYALLTALIDLCLERSSGKGVPPSSITTRQLAEKVIELYWPHAVPYEGGGVLRQGGSRKENQAEILRAISTFRSDHAGGAGELIYRAGLVHREAFRRLVDTVEWKLIAMPIPRLQRSGRDEDRFLYQYSWTASVRRAEVSRYQAGHLDSFDNALTLLPGVAEHLIALAGVLRPVIRREWALMVARMNELPEARLEEVLFGSKRVPLDSVRGPLAELQGARCFYCRDALRQKGDVDHFIPWARYSDNSLDNLVVAHPRCNGQKRDFFAAQEHLSRWVERSRAFDVDLDAIAQAVSWPRHLQRSVAVSRTMYSRLPAGTRLWVRGEHMVPLDKNTVEDCFED